MKSASVATPDPVSEMEALLERNPKVARKPQLIVDAARVASRPILDLLLRRGADPNASWRGYRPLHALIQEKPHANETAASPRRIKCLDFLLSHGADPEQLGAWPPARARIVAAITGIGAFVERLSASGARSDGFTACAEGDLAGARREPLKGVPGFAEARDAGGLTALQCAAASRLGKSDPKLQQRLLAIATLLLDAGAVPDAPTKSWGHDIHASYLAASAHHAAMYDLLLARGADATLALPAAVWNAGDDFGAMGEIALRYGADIDRAVGDGRPLLNDLVRWGQVRPALWLLEHGADANLSDPNGWTALHYAASRGSERLWLALVDRGGDVTRRDGAGKTPVDVAREKKRTKLLRSLAG